MLYGVKHLILADPWGFSKHNKNGLSKRMLGFLKYNVYIVSRLRIAGGDWIIRIFKYNMLKKYEPILKNETSLIAEYLCLINFECPTLIWFIYYFKLLNDWFILFIIKNNLAIAV